MLGGVSADSLRFAEALAGPHWRSRTLGCSQILRTHRGPTGDLNLEARSPRLMSRQFKASRSPRHTTVPVGPQVRGPTGTPRAPPYDYLRRRFPPEASGMTAARTRTISAMS